MASNELTAKLQRRQDINEGVIAGDHQRADSGVFNPYTEFHEFSRKEIQGFLTKFKTYDVNMDGFIDFEELKKMMEKLGVPQTHLGLKEMIKQVDEDFDGKISQREFLLIFRKAAAGELAVGSGLESLYANITEIDVDKEGVSGAAKFFQAKADELNKQDKYMKEILEEQEEKKRLAEEKKLRQAEFKAKMAGFQQTAS